MTSYLRSRLLFGAALTLICGVFSAIKAQPVRAAANIVEDLVGQRELTNDECEDPNTCMGWNYCRIAVQRDGASDVVKEWVLFNEFNNVPIFKIFKDSTGKRYNQYTINFNCTQKACGFNVSNIQWYGGDQKEDFVGACQYENAFCCCRNVKGRLDDCTRGVDYGPGPTPVATCEGFSNNDGLGSDYRPFTEKQYPQYANVINKGAGCQAFQDAVNKSEDAKTAVRQTPTQSSINIKERAASLKQSNFSSAEQVIAQLIKLLVSFIGSIALALYIGAGIIWMTSAGNAERIEKSKSIFVWTTLGVIIMLASYFLVKFLFNILNV